jgi:hypothetical protein
MPRPKLGNKPISLRFTPAVDAALVAIARDSGVLALNESHDPVGPIAVEAMCWFLERESLPVPARARLDEIVIDWTKHEKLVRAAVDSISTEPKSVTRSFVVPVSVLDELDSLRNVVDEWSRYQTKIKWDSHAGEYVLVRRNTPMPPSLVQWAAIIEWLSARGSALRYGLAESSRRGKDAA